LPKGDCILESSPVLFGFAVLLVYVYAFVGGFEHFWNNFAADPKKSIPEAARRVYAAAYARADGMRAGFEYFKAFEQDAKDFAAFSATKLAMPVLVLTGEKASGTCNRSGLFRPERA
jgi:hypothetical protein